MYQKRGLAGRLMLAVALWLLWGCAHHQPLPDESYHWVYEADGSGQTAVQEWLPAFVAYGHADAFNRIGRPKIRLESDGDQDVYIDPEDPVVYYLKRSFSTEKATYTNLVYRVHFPRVPFSLIP
jgi:hypothetical protein